jgi:type IV pilus assembly protein PilV
MRAAQQTSFSKARLRARGSTLIEVLIAVLILSIGLIGSLKLQTEGVRLNADSRYTVLASTLAQDALDAIAFDTANEKSTWTSITETTAATGVTGRASDWLTRVQRNLPDGKANISCASNQCKIILLWTPPGRAQVKAIYEMYNS